MTKALVPQIMVALAKSKTFIDCCAEDSGFPAQEPAHSCWLLPCRLQAGGRQLTMTNPLPGFNTRKSIACQGKNPQERKKTHSESRDAGEIGFDYAFRNCVSH
jgi:hypothetical protein